MKKHSAFSLPERVQTQWTAFFRDRHEIQFAKVFGSRARGDFDLRSDIDVAISAPRITVRQWLDIAAFFEEETATLLSVDAVRWENSSPALRKKIQQEGRLIYERR